MTTTLFVMTLIFLLCCLHEVVNQFKFIKTYLTNGDGIISVVDCIGLYFIATVYVILFIIMLYCLTQIYLIS